MRSSEVGQVNIPKPNPDDSFTVKIKDLADILHAAVKRAGLLELDYIRLGEPDDFMRHCLHEIEEHCNTAAQVAEEVRNETVGQNTQD